MRRIVLLIGLLLLVRPALGVATSAPGAVDSLIQDLGDPDPATRQHAGEKLTAMGAAARPALVKAARGGSPQISSRASELLMKLPWGAPTDPAAVQDALVNYGSADNDTRKQTIKAIALAGGGESAILRLVEEEPSDDVSWYAATWLRSFENEKITTALRNLDLTDARVQSVALAAQAFLPIDRAKSLQLFRRAVEEDANDDGSDDYYLDFGYRVLLSDAMESGDLKRAAGLRRLRAHRAVSSGDASEATFALLAFYADHGPTDEMPDDVTEFAPYLGRPDSMIAMARLEDAIPGGSTLLKDAIEQSALASTSISLETQVRVGSEAADYAWDREARLVLYPILSMPDPRGDMLRASAQIDAHLLLAKTDEVIEDHAAVAEHLNSVIQLSEKPGAPMEVNIDALKSQVGWHRLHAARDSGDKQTADKILRELFDLPAPDSDVAIEVVQALQSLGRTDDAKVYFDRAYRLQNLVLKLPARRDEALNNLAWLCARCGEHTDEAVTTAQRALAIEPEQYMYLDTAASAEFAAGNPAKAVSLEQRALNFRPNDAFMRKQLQAFKKANTGK